MCSLENYGLDNSTDNLNTFSTLVDLLQYRAKYQPDKQAYIFLQDGETESGILTYGELERQARRSPDWQCPYYDYHYDSLFNNKSKAKTQN